VGDILGSVNSPVVQGFLSASMRLAIPILLAALGGVFNEKSGVLNIGMEGMMIVGSLVGFVTGYFLHSLWLGVLAAALSGIVLGIVLGVFVITLRADQVVAGLALSLLCLGLTSLLFRVIFGVGTASPRVNSFAALPVPFLGDLPIIGPLLFRQSPLGYITYGLVVLSFVVIFRTGWGLSIIATGENPEAAETLGVNVARTRYLCMMVSGVLCAMGGVFLSIDATGLFINNMTAGRGYIALALLILGRRHPFGLMAAALMFGAADALQLRTQILNIGVPFQFMLMLPYILTMVVLATFVRRTDNPAALGVHYRHGGEKE
jgi:general nucleoside transport system permease protein